MAAYKISSDTLTAIADAIRSKTGKTAALTLDQMPTEIDGIETGGSGGPLQAKTAYPSHSEQVIIPDEDYYGLAAVNVLAVPDAENTIFKPEQIDPDVLYGIGYNWFSDFVRMLNGITLQNNTLTPKQIKEKVDGLGHIASRATAQREHTNIPSTTWDININSTAAVVQEG